MAEDAKLKATILKAHKKHEHDQRDICDSTRPWQEITPEDMQRHSRMEESRRNAKEWDANVRKELQEEMMELKWRIVAGEMVRNIQGDEYAVTCMEVLGIMQDTRGDKALVAAVRGTVIEAVEDGRDTSGDEGNAVEDGRDTSGDKATHMAGDFCRQAMAYDFLVRRRLPK